MNNVTVPLLFNYVDRSWAKGQKKNFISASNPNNVVPSSDFPVLLSGVLKLPEQELAYFT
jgi:hypothetical protein